MAMKLPKQSIQDGLVSKSLKPKKTVDYLFILFEQQFKDEKAFLINNNIGI